MSSTSIVTLALVSAILLTGFSREVHSAKWSHHDLDAWPKLCQYGEKQSPIDLDESVAIDLSEEPFKLFGYSSDYETVLMNNGHSVVVNLVDDNAKPIMKGGGLNDSYTLHHIHFHWGSEHTFNGERLPLEAHFVHYATRFKSLEAAVQEENGLAVLGTMFKLSPDDVEPIEFLTEIMEQIADSPNVEVQINGTIRPRDYLPCDLAGFFRYSGSLTTPGCNEVVVWTVFTNVLTLSKQQAKYFELIDLDTFRPVQKLNDRQLYLKRSPINSAQTQSAPIILTLAGIILSSIYSF
ncbi:PREDICTED: putative carbonic anhydrase 3 [Nicrophorus vespilloides]|uniref:Carbonic anhydrase 3 n=1 Tax=Nicrophorus vespilloides TaxID=110193 RepID=A0ABM1MS33_NICVS|nr:PREDICTED: putative carbonic anhydrase 3 [Nicrophorus vespilloides]